MHADYAAFRELGAEIVVVAREEAAVMRERFEADRLPFIGVPDPTGELGRLYRQQWKLLKKGRMPACFVIDRQARLAFVHYGRSMTDIPENTSILQLIRSLERPAGGTPRESAQGASLT